MSIPISKSIFEYDLLGGDSMLRVFVDSGSSIKQNEKDTYQVEIMPLRILLGDKEYFDGIDLTMDEFYHQLIDNNQFPKTSLPSIYEWTQKIEQCTKNGDDVIVLTISSKISSTYESFHTALKDNPKVRVIDTRIAVGGIRLLVDEINRNRDQDLDTIVEKVNQLIPRVKVLAIPESLTYLCKGGRLSKVSYLLGTAFKIIPVITFKDGSVVVEKKLRGFKKGLQYIADSVKSMCSCLNHEIIASFTHTKENVMELIRLLDDRLKGKIHVYDDLDPAVACHWGPNAVGLIFIADNNISI